MINWIRRRRRHSYNDLWHIVYGGLHEGDKGLLRERLFTAEVLGGWRLHADMLASMYQDSKDAIRRVNELHYKNDRCACEKCCIECGADYPCPTKRAANGI